MKMSMLVLLAVATLTGASQRNVQTLKLATGEMLSFPFQSGIPTPSESAWAFCRGAGPAFAPDGKDIRLNWVVDLRLKRSALRDVSAVKVQEVSGPEVLTLFTGTPKPTKDGLMIYAPGELVTRSAYPWLYRTGSDRPGHSRRARTARRKAGRPAAAGPHRSGRQETAPGPRLLALTLRPAALEQ